MINLCFVGDIFPGGVLLYQGGIAQDVKELLNKSDIRVANLESALYNGKDECKIKMSDPTLGNLVFSPEQCVGLLKELNINVVSLANNHICDCGYKGLSRTIEILEDNGIAHFGAGRNEDETRKPAIVHIKGKKVCFLGYFPPEWEAPYPPQGNIGGLNQFIIDDVLADVEKYKKTCDYVFVYPHWGKEHTIFPLYWDVDRLHKIIEAGATGILGTHSHCPQTSFVYKNCAVAMSLGNFIFPDRYIISPRKTYYPTEKERNRKDIPVTYDFPIVKEMTMVKMHENGRIGLICNVTLDDKKVKMKKYHTILDKDNFLRIYNISKIEQVKIDSVKWLVLAEKFKLYRLCCRIINICLSRFTKIKYRLGSWNVR